MWVAKFRMRHDDCIGGVRTKKFNCLLYVYPIKLHKEGSQIVFTLQFILMGSDKNKKQFIKDLKREKRLHRLEVNEDIVFITYKDGLKRSWYRHFLDPEIFYIKPLIIYETGWEQFEIGSWEKEPLVRCLNAVKAHFEFKLISIDKKYQADFFFSRPVPKLSPKQKEALQLAVQGGYYEIPRKTDLESLGKKMGVSRQTFEQHLRYAQRKTIPFMAQSAT